MFAVDVRYPDPGTGPACAQIVLTLGDAVVYDWTIAYRNGPELFDNNRNVVHRVAETFVAGRLREVLSRVERC